jgi:hypothetical protein
MLPFVMAVDETIPKDSILKVTGKMMWAFVDFYLNLIIQLFQVLYMEV